jgi:hypothetical protein
MFRVRYSQTHGQTDIHKAETLSSYLQIHVKNQAFLSDGKECMGALLCTYAKHVMERRGFSRIQSVVVHSSMCILAQRNQTLEYRKRGFDQIFSRGVLEGSQAGRKNSSSDLDAQTLRQGTAPACYGAHACDCIVYPSELSHIFALCVSLVLVLLHDTSETIM